MANQIFSNQVTANSSVTVAMLTANPGLGVALVSATLAVALEFSPVVLLSSSLIAGYTTTYNSAVTTYTLTSGNSALSAGALTAVNSAYDSLSTTRLSAFKSYTYANTAGTSLSSGQGSVILDSMFIGQTLSLRTSDRSGFLFVPTTAVAVTLTANGKEGWGPENMRLRNLGYC